MTITRVTVTLDTSPSMSGVGPAINNNFHFSTDSKIHQEHCEEMVAAFKNFYSGPAAGPWLGGQILGTGMVTFIDLADPLPRAAYYFEAIDGIEHATDAIPQEVAMLISAKRGRAFGAPKGAGNFRVYCGPMAAGSIDTATGLWTQAAVDSMAALWAGFLGDLPAGVEWVTGSDITAYAAPTSCWVTNEPATMRSRQNAETYRAAVAL